MTEEEAKGYCESKRDYIGKKVSYWKTIYTVKSITPDSTSMGYGIVISLVAKHWKNYTGYDEYDYEDFFRNAQIQT